MLLLLLLYTKVGLKMTDLEMVLNALLARQALGAYLFNCH